MSRYLLDTHALLWWLNGDGELPDSVREGIEAAERLYVSAASIVDSYHLTHKREPVLDRPAWKTLVELLRHWPDDAVPLEVAPIDATIAWLATRLHPRIKDPWDGFIAATAESLGVPLISRDTELAALQELPAFGDLQVRWDRPTKWWSGRWSEPT